MNAIKYACSLNNHGVDLLVSGESSRAIDVFQSALCPLQKFVREAATNSCTEMNISCDDTTLPFCESTSAVSDLQGLHCYVYDRGIMISDNVKDDADTVATLSLYIAILVFNLALACHSEGTALGLGREKSLLKACELYSLVVLLLTESTIPENMSTTVLTLLALNNKAQIHYDWCEYIQSADCMSQISKVMGSICGLHSVLHLEYVEGLLLNVMLLSKPTAARAA
jgi:hypothetical protein